MRIYGESGPSNLILFYFYLFIFLFCFVFWAAAKIVFACVWHPLFLTRKTAITSRLIDIFETLIDRFHETFVCINCSVFFFNMHSNIYSCLFRDANIKEENIIDSHAA